MHKMLGSVPPPHNLVMVAHACDVRTREVKAGVLERQGYCYVKLDAISGYMKPSFKQTTNSSILTPQKEHLKGPYG